MTGLIYQVNVKSNVLGERGIPKLPVDSVDVLVSGLAQDYNRYRTEKKKSDLGHAVLLLPYETIQDLNGKGWPVAPGDLGENFTTFGISYRSLESGSQYSVGERVRLEITEPSLPCIMLAVE